MLQLASGEEGFAENAWVGHTLAIGTAVRLNITGPCGRCVMTTLAQGDLPMDPGILRASLRARLTRPLERQGDGMARGRRRQREPGVAVALTARERTVLLEHTFAPVTSRDLCQEEGG